MGYCSRLSLSAGALGMAITGFVTTASAADPIVLRMTQSFSETSNLYQLFAPPLVKRVEELTDGQVVIEPYPAGVIAPAFDAYDAVIDGTADAVQASAAYLVSRDPANAMFGVLPGGMGPEALSHWMWSGGGNELLAEHRRETMGLHSMACGFGATELFAHSHKPLQSVDDFKGLKFRTAGAFADILTAMGASPTVVPGGEVYTMLERGAIDATEWSGPSENIKAGLHEVAKYIIYPGVHTRAFFQEFAVDAEKWDAIPPELQVKIEAACRLSSLDTLMAFDALDREAWAQMQSGNNEIIRLDDATIDRINEEGRKWVYAIAAEQEAAGNTWTTRIADAYFAFHDDWLDNTSFRAVDNRQ